MPKMIVMTMRHFMRCRFIELAERVLTSMQEMDMELRNFIMLAEKDTKATISLLLEKGANVNAKSNGGDTPLHWASKYGNDAIISYCWKMVLRSMSKVNMDSCHFIMLALEDKML
jgi:hypothetical protein